jgi:NTP pyrophosphatase (non-canonical NTP hydrolase)
MAATLNADSEHRQAIRPAANMREKTQKNLRKQQKLLQSKAGFPTHFFHRCPRDNSVSDSDSSSAPLVDVVKLAASLQRFADDRDWQQFHSPKNLILALTGEVGELCEIFQWMSDADSISAATDPEIGQAVEDELADVLMYLVRLSSVLGIDLNEAVTRKLASNGQKYPVDKAKSNSKKYDRL